MGSVRLRQLADGLTVGRAVLGLPMLLARELLITGWRSGLSSGGPASTSAKAKTVLQFLALVLLLWPAAWPLAAPLQSLGWWLFWPSLALALWSAVGYARQA